MNIKNILSGIVAGISAAFVAIPAHAFTTFTTKIRTDDGVITKIVLDGTDPWWYPVEVTICASICAAAYVYFKEGIGPSDQNTEVEAPLTAEELLKGKFPGVEQELPSSLSRGIAKLIESDPDFSCQTFIRQVEALYAKSIKARLTREWGGLKYSIPYSLCLKMQNHKIKASKYRPLSTRILDIQSYNTGSEKAIIEFKGYAERPEGSTIEEEIWTFERFKGVKSKLDADMTVCPSCGCSDEPDMDGKCPSCQAETLNGKFGWVLLQTEKKQSPMDSFRLPRTASRRGGTCKTVIQEKIADMLDFLQKRDPLFSQEKACDAARSMTVDYYRSIVGLSDSGASICSDNMLREYPLTRDSVMKRHEKLPCTDVKVIGSALSRVIKDSKNDILTYRIWTVMSFNSDGQAITSVFSDYATITRAVGSNDWKLEMLEEDEDYKQ